MSGAQTSMDIRITGPIPQKFPFWGKVKERGICIFIKVPGDSILLVWGLAFENHCSRCPLSLWYYIESEKVNCILKASYSFSKHLLSAYYTSTGRPGSKIRHLRDQCISNILVFAAVIFQSRLGNTLVSLFISSGLIKFSGNCQEQLHILVTLL